jgi:hypothetical protein
MAAPISQKTWQELIELNGKCSWAKKGVFATAVGRHYISNSPQSILYVGKSAGKRGENVSLANSQIDVGIDAAHWMETWRLTNSRSNFWQLISKITDVNNIAWTNVSKMDKLGTKGEPPRGRNWKAISHLCIQSLSEEIQYLKPKNIIFVISKDYKAEVVKFLTDSNFQFDRILPDGCTEIYKNNDVLAFMTKHPLGWSNIERSHLISTVSKRIN